MMSLEGFLIWVFILFTTGAYAMWRHGEKAYDRGITDAVLMHNAGRLTYDIYYDEDDEEMINIEIKPDE